MVDVTQRIVSAGGQGGALGKLLGRGSGGGQICCVGKRIDLSRQAPWRHGLWSRRLVTPLEHEWYTTILCGGAECRARTFCRRHGRGVGRCVGKHLKKETGGVGGRPLVAPCPWPAGPHPTPGPRGHLLP